MIKKQVRRMKRIWLFATNGFRPKLATVTGVEYFGSEYGGWPLVTALVDESSTIFSFGLGTDISFDLAVIERFNSVVHGFDPTPKSAEWIGTQSLPEKFKFHQVGLADFDGNLEFQAPENPNFVSYSSVASATKNRDIISLPVKRLSTFLSEIDIQHLDVLKMDIEGSENSVIDDLLKTDIRPTQILVEFHHRIHESPFSDTRKAIDDLTAASYELFYISDHGDEFAFVLR